MKIKYPTLTATITAVTGPMLRQYYSTSQRTWINWCPAFSFRVAAIYKFKRSSGCLCLVIAETRTVLREQAFPVPEPRFWDSPCSCLFCSITVSVRSAQYLPHCITLFCSIALSLCLSVLLNISLSVSVRSAQYLTHYLYVLLNISLIVSLCSAQYLTLYNYAHSAQYLCIHLTLWFCCSSFSSQVKIHLSLYNFISLSLSPSLSLSLSLSLFLSLSNC